MTNGALDLIERIAIGILVTWVCLSIHQIAIYEEHVYDCSNMVADQEQFFNYIGIDTDIGVRYETEDKCGHVWLILPFGIPFECTALCIQPFFHTPDEVFDSVEELITINPVVKDEFIN